MIELYDLAGADPAVRFSPYCWRTRMALAHKGLDVTTHPWRFTERERLAFSGQGRVPVIRDGGEVVFDSWTIARHLEATYADRPSLFNGAGGMAHARFVNSWADTVLNAGIAPLIIADIHAAIDEKDKEYFRSSREARFGRRLEEVQAGREQGVARFRESLAPLRATLAAQPFLGGASPSYADYIPFGGFMWARVTSAFELLEASDPISAWRETMLDLHGGLARSAAVGYRRSA
mgnify:CR=1 FL=1